jgi:acetyl-CoA C-acetyltransferase
MIPFLIMTEYGHQEMTDGIVKDGLWDVYNNFHMGVCAERTASEHNISREAQDEYAIRSYKNSAKAWSSNLFDKEIAPVTIKTRKGEKIIKEDEEYHNVDFDKVKLLKSAFQKNGTVTAANSSTLNDGASAVILMSEEQVKELNVEPLARIESYADAACEPEKFTIAPSLAIPIALSRAKMNLKQVDLWEINEAFSLVALVNQKVTFFLMSDFGNSIRKTQCSWWRCIIRTSHWIIRLSYFSFFGTCIEKGTNGSCCNL